MNKGCFRNENNVKILSKNGDANPVRRGAEIGDRFDIFLMRGKMLGENSNVRA